MRLTQEQILRFCVALVAMAICALALTGCWQSRSDETTDQQREKTSHWTGTIALPIPATPTTPASVVAVPIELTQRETETTATVAHSETKQGMDGAALGQQIANGAIAMIKQALPPAAAMMPTPAPGSDWASIGGAALAALTGATGVGAALRGRLKDLSQQVEYHRSDADHAYRKVEEYALKIDPKSTMDRA